jgi:hypothetical protein
MQVSLSAECCVLREASIHVTQHVPRITGHVTTQLPLRRLRITLLTGQFSVDQGIFALKALTEPSQGLSGLSSYQVTLVQRHKAQL